MSDFQLAPIDVQSLDYQEACTLHNQIILNGSMAAQSLVEMCRGLKVMRDKRAYTHLGYQSFEDYSERAANIGRRQAYNYIAALERLGPEAMQSNAHLGITKLELLSQLPEAALADVLESGQAEDMTTREVKDLVAELTKAREQLSLLQDESESDKQETAEDLRKKDIKISDLTEQIKKLERSIETEKRSIQLEADRKAQGKIAAAQKGADAKAEVARTEGYEAGKAAVAASLEASDREKAEALARARELEKKLSVSSSPDSAVIAYLFDDLQKVYGKILNSISKIAITDQEAAEKFRGAMLQYITRMGAQLMPAQGGNKE